MFTQTVDCLKKAGIDQPEVGLILGSGLGDLVESFDNSLAIPYDEIPDFPVSTVAGHAGQLVYGDLSGKKVLALQGRFHFYEGYDLQTVTYPVRVFHELGIKHLIVTNAAGGVNESFQPGDLMLITDHINFTGFNPLMGPNLDDHGVRFPDMSEAYSRRTGTLVRKIAQEAGFELKEGVYAWWTGPSYETPAEIRAFRALGADAVGMSTVPEVTVAKHCGMEVTGISCITNLAAGLQANLSHEDVMATSAKIKPRFKNLIAELLLQID